MKLQRDCFHFRGHVPCRPHKEKGVHCEGCPDFRPRAGRILIVKLGAAGDVIRTTPLLHVLKRDYPDHILTWVTDFPDLLPDSVDDPARLDTPTELWLRHTPFDLVINLDKDRQACALAASVQAGRRWGFTLGDDGMCRPVTEGVTPQQAAAAQAKFHTGLFDDVNQACTLSYPQEIFAICGYEFAGQEYILDRPQPAPHFDLPEGTLVGLNTGCGGRWTSRLWPEDHWAALASGLQDAGLVPVLLGGPDEDARNRRLSAATGAVYPGHFDLRTFLGLMDRCEIVVTAVTMAMHIALGLGKKLVLFNNIFNPREFELYGRGRILAPDSPCTCFFQPRCRRKDFCLETLRPEAALAAVIELADRT
ncbi:glycosyltransferase family 9 protein [bacterium CG17_big_fil_post_rev_8_21_14_2_50_64_8]|nr:MAG: glycosyltransferase family 9 protein [bacterium CG17_big_fil_post_rev_8_21_14_2_50_64_8]PJA73972.1 MAG: glycosyltransferase family 9 protein [bacterium CG_4_9_14_3_um_filter_65_15]